MKLAATGRGSGVAEPASLTFLSALARGSAMARLRFSVLLQSEMECAICRSRIKKYPTDTALTWCYKEADHRDRSRISGG